MPRRLLLNDDNSLCVNRRHLNSSRTRITISILVGKAEQQIFYVLYMFSPFLFKHRYSPRCVILLMHRDGQNSVKYYASRWASIKIHIIFDKYLIRARMKSLGGQICFTIIPDSLIDSIVETINHIHYENTSQQFSEQNFFSVTLCAVCCLMMTILYV